MSSPHQPGFTGSAIDRADHLRLDTARMEALADDPRARLMLLSILDPVLDEEGRLTWSTLAEYGEGADLIFLGLEEGEPRFAPLVRADGMTRWSVYPLLDRMAPGDAALWGAARSLNEWHNRNRFCSVCGAGTELFRAGWGRKCPGCTAEHYPRVDPVVIMLAQHQGRVLLGRQPQYPPGRYSALAGFVEPGESIEEAVAREILEEAGVLVGDVRYVASQPWPFPGSLMIACVAAAQDDAITLDTHELEDARWFDRAAVEAALRGDGDAPFKAPPRFAIAHTLLRRWLDGI
jgi:NAD+ diphosphatase